MDTQTAITFIVGLLSPFVLRYVPFKGEQMVAFTWLLSFAIGALVVLVGSGTTGWTATNLADKFALIYVSQQAVYNLLKDRLKLNG